MVGTPIDQLPSWIASWSRVDPGLISVNDINRDGILQLNELSIGTDIVVLAMPEIGGLPTSSPAWWRPAAWRRPCPPPTGCC